MDKEEATALIEAAGGNTAFAELLGITDDPGFQQRVSNWRERGIPARVILEHQLVIEALRRKVKVAA
jgi:hypothetical protein